MKTFIEQGAFPIAMSAVAIPEWPLDVPSPVVRCADKRTIWSWRAPGLIQSGFRKLRLIRSRSALSNGEVVRLNGPADALAHGVVLVPEDRKAQGLILSQTIGENLALGNYPRVAPSGWITSGRTQVFAQRGITRLLIKGTADQSVGTLSGGNQQKVVIAKSIPREPKVVILDEPTRGIDVGARAAIYEIVAELARGGMAVIVVSSDLDEVLGLSHRVMVLSRGANRGVLEREKAGRVAVMERATS